MLITLWHGSSHPHGEEHVSPPLELKVNIIAVSHFVYVTIIESTKYSN